MNQFPISRRQLLRYFGGSLDSAVEHLARQIEQGVIDFPWQAGFSLPAEELFRNLQKYQPQPYHEPFVLGPYYPNYNLYRPPLFRGQYVLIRPGLQSYYNIDVLSDLFNERERLKAKKSDQLSPIECWQNPQCLRRLVRNALDNTRPQQGDVVIDSRVLREALFNATYEARQFRPTWIKGIIGVIFPRLPQGTVLNILDISAGWGDRLVTAMAMGHNYWGFDPNVNLQSGYQRMIEKFGHPDRHRVDPLPFEEAVLPSESFDLVLSSPPFFDLEIYTDQTTQSVTRFPQFRIWLVDFLFRSLHTAWNALKPGGYLAIHMGDTRAFQVCEPMNLFIEQLLPHSSWEGVIGLVGGRGRASPVWVWKKLIPGQPRKVWSADAATTPRRTDQKEGTTNPLMDRPFHRLYPSIWRLVVASLAGSLSTNQDIAATTVSSEEAVANIVDQVRNQVGSQNPLHQLATEWLTTGYNPVLVDHLLKDPNSQAVEILTTITQRYLHGLSIRPS